MTLSSHFHRPMCVIRMLFHSRIDRLQVYINSSEAIDSSYSAIIAKIYRLSSLRYPLQPLQIKIKDEFSTTAMSSAPVSAGGAQTPQAPAQNTIPVAPAPLDPAIREFVAQELYKRYKLIRASMDPDNEPAKSKDASLQEDWESLSEHLKASTRAQADDIPRKLELTGYQMSQANDETKDGLQPIEKFTPEQLEYLGEVEHDRWVSERIKSGWQAAGKRDSSAQKTPFFTPYAELEQKWKDVDKFMVEGIFEILGLAGYRVFSKN
ncbi:hypothetical protein TWF102_009880 [Orbilia oligospora]|uniref:Ryanodine receptor Ryr domain-containing protein n=1 Tax=Orbilia oligospora TaxID=2813651 RepID=A0A7C8JBP5_ORBOL|nr:hypothetical protein TWF103_011136 [Orbilia oligospora]KAF3109098.1 hypothetical protein TWF102_009880 [Orbilia oligospora]KAF3114003.1 hypothetical protein TWF706_009351 [Orbilia oligospora]KAF3122847.1 hypothetical protein TWF594_002588 [Orbilia oligospora]